MATTYVPLTKDAWTLVSSAVDFLVHNQSDRSLHVRFDATLPTGGLDSNATHNLRPDDAIGRGGLAGNLYAYTDSTGISLTRSE